MGMLSTAVARRRFIKAILAAIFVIINAYAFTVWFHHPDMWGVQPGQNPLDAVTAQGILAFEAVILVIAGAICLAGIVNFLGEKVTAWVRSGS